MCQKIDKQSKLTQVYNEITNIKAQISSFMQSNSQHNSNSTTNIKILPQNHIGRSKKTEKKTNNQMSRKQVDKNAISKGIAHYTSLKYIQAPFQTQKIQRDAKPLLQKPRNPFTGQISFTKASLKFPVYAQENHKKMQTHFQKTEKIKTQASTLPSKIWPLPLTAAIQKNMQNRFFHTRHKSQAQVNSHKQLSKSKSNQKMKLLSFKQRVAIMKHSFLNKRLTNTIKEQKQEKQQNQESDINQKTKRLMRMHSDITDPGQNSQKRHFALKSKQRIRFLENKIKQKDKTIQLLSTELHKIQKIFNQMQTNLRKILSTRTTESQLMQQGDVNNAIEQFCRELLEKRKDIKNQKKQNQTICITSFQLQKSDLQSKLQNLASKLEVAVNQNKLKDQFIFNYLLSNNQEQEKHGWASQTLRTYLEKFNYPNNRLLQMLNLQQEKIHNLQKIIQNLKKK